MEGVDAAARGAFRPPRAPAAAQKFADCFQIHFEGAEVFAFLPEKRPPWFPGASRVGGAIPPRLAGRWVEEVKSWTVEGA